MTDITTLEQMGYRFKLRIDYDCPNNPPPEAVELLRKLKARRDEAVRYLAMRLLAGESGFFEIPFDAPIPGCEEVRELALTVLQEATTDKPDLMKIRKAAATAGHYVDGKSNAERLFREFRKLYLN